MQGTQGVAPEGGDRGSPIHMQAAAYPAFAADVEADGETAVLRLAGEFDLSNVGAAQVALTKALEQSRSGSVVVDMRELTFIDSTGIAFLVRAIQDQGGSLTIRESSSPAVRRILGLVGIPAFALDAGASVDGR